MELLRRFFANVMQEALESLDDYLAKTPEGDRGDYNHVGCTACIVGITSNFILCANVGDSGAALYLPDRLIPISTTHRITDPKEIQRIRSAGYAIMEGRIEGQLAVTRALGDFEYKQCGGKKACEQAVCCLPDVTIRPVPYLTPHAMVPTTITSSPTSKVRVPSSTFSSSAGLDYSHTHSEGEEGMGKVDHRERSTPPLPPPLPPPPVSSSQPNTMTTNTSRCATVEPEIVLPPPKRTPGSGEDEEGEGEATRGSSTAPAALPASGIRTARERWGVVIACDGVWDTLTKHQVHYALMNTENDLVVAESTLAAVLAGRELLHRKRRGPKRWIAPGTTLPHHLDTKYTERKKEEAAMKKKLLEAQRRGVKASGLCVRSSSFWEEEEEEEDGEEGEESLSKSRKLLHGKKRKTMKKKTKGVPLPCEEQGGGPGSPLESSGRRAATHVKEEDEADTKEGLERKGTTRKVQIQHDEEEEEEEMDGGLDAPVLPSKERLQHRQTLPKSPKDAKKEKAVSPPRPLDGSSNHPTTDPTAPLPNDTVIPTTKKEPTDGKSTGVEAEKESEEEEAFDFLPPFEEDLGSVISIQNGFEDEDDDEDDEEEEEEEEEGDEMERKEEAQASLRHEPSTKQVSRISLESEKEMRSLYREGSDQLQGHSSAAFLPLEGTGVSTDLSFSSSSSPKRKRSLAHRNKDSQKKFGGKSLEEIQERARKRREMRLRRIRARATVIDPMLLMAAAGIFAQCVAPEDNDEGVGMDNCSVMLIENRSF